MSLGIDYPAAMFQYAHRPVIPVQVKDAQGNWQTVHMLSDSGNDITIINMRTAMQLGFNDGMGVQTEVRGIGNQSQPSVARDGVYIRIGDTAPIPITVLIMNTDMNLLGRKDIFDNFRVTFDQNNVIYEQTCQFCGGV